MSSTTIRSWVAVTALLLPLQAVGCGGDDAGSDAGDGASADGTAGTGDDGVGGSGDADAGSDGVGQCGGTPTWSAADWDANTADALGLRAQLDTLIGDPTMRGAETGDVALTGLADLTDIWDGSPSLAAVASPGHTPVVEAAFDEFVSILAAGDQDLMDGDGLWAPGADGGIWGDSTRGINEGGLEVRQFVDKGSYTGVLYAYAVSLTEGDITPATIDAIAATWGTNATLDPDGDLTDAAGYAFDMGFHAEMADALAAAQTHAGDAQCQAERDAALVTFFNLWEQSMFARMVFYGNRAEGKLLAATTPSEFADVLHDLAEGVALIAGFAGMPEPTAGPLVGERIFTEAHVSTVMDGFGVDLGALGSSTVGVLLESLPALEAAVEAGEGATMDAYGVDAATVAGYAMPTAG